MAKHFEFVLGDTIDVGGSKLTRIRAVVDLPIHNVVAGQLGGYLEHEGNLRGDAWVDGNAWVFGLATVRDKALVTDSSRVYDHAKVTGRSVVRGCSCVYENAHIADFAVIAGTTQVRGRADVGDRARVGGMASVLGLARIYGNADVTGSSTVGEYAELGYNAKVCGNAYIEKPSDVLVIGPAKSSGRFTTAYRTVDGSIVAATGCFFGYLDEFRKAIKRTHRRDKEYLEQYMLFANTIERNFAKDGVLKQVLSTISSILKT